MRSLLISLCLLFTSTALATPRSVAVDGDDDARLLADLTLRALLDRGREVFDAPWVPEGSHPGYSLTVDGGVAGANVTLARGDGEVVARYALQPADSAATLRGQAADLALRVERAVAAGVVATR